jgi:hypothetical protein
MKQFFVIAVLLSLAVACAKEDKTLDSAIITGLDPRDCMCCGGWFIEINDTTRRFDQLPADCLIDFTAASYPMKVRAEWKKKDTLCLGDEIRLIRLIKD